jgi:hypothetical protein
MLFAKFFTSIFGPTNECLSELDDKISLSSTVITSIFDDASWLMQVIVLSVLAAAFVGFPVLLVLKTIGTVSLTVRAHSTLDITGFNFP